MKKYVPKLILEGTALAFGEELAQAINNHPRIIGPENYCYHRPIISGRWCAFTNFPWGRGLVNFEPQEEALAMEAYHTWARIFELERYYSWMIDRFHLSTRAFQLQAYGKDFDFTWLEQRLAPLGFHLVFVTCSQASYEERLREIGENPDPMIPEDAAKVVMEQNLMWRLVEKSILPSLTIDYSERDPDQSANQVADWLEKTDGLFLNNPGF